MLDLPEVILASTSPQRQQILRELGIRYTIVAKDTPEIVGETPQETVTANARLKGLDVMPDVTPGSIIVAADTVLSQNGKIFGKPSDAHEAKKILKGFSNKSVQAFSGVAVLCAGENQGWVGVESAEVEFFEVSDNFIDWYIRTEEPLSRAGAIGISRIGEILIESIRGSYSCIAGLPKRTLLACLTRMGLVSIEPEMPTLFIDINTKITTFPV